MAEGIDDPTGDQVAADRLDREITAVLAGQVDRGADPTLLWLATAVRTEPSPALHRRVLRRVDAAEARRWRPVQLVAAVFGVVLMGHGLGNLWNHNWVADNLHEGRSPHAYIEGGLAILAVTIVLAAGVLTYRALPYAVASAAPLGILFGVRGFGEIGEFTGGAILHIGQGVLGVALVVVWWWARRYGPASDDEGGA